MKLIDTHTHLYDEAFDPDRAETVERIKAAGICKCILPAIDRTSYRRQTEFAEEHKGFAFEGMGVHPTSVDANWRDELAFARERLYESGREYVAVGEIGIDCYWSRDYVEEQKELFLQQLLWAHDLHLPVIVHTREATQELFDVLERLKAELSAPAGNLGITGVFHAWSGSIETFERLRRYSDFKVGIGGVVTYKNSGLVKTLPNIPLEEILLETDSPYLTPVPFRGRRNESSYVKYVAEKIAEVKGITVEEVAEVTTSNAEGLFGI